ncbi:MAG: 50S ribosomal protein L37ae [Nanoarchaeota archaeon]|nr:50S ribosomal protein L37ae [Nanoarchaeota archaeon]
MPTKSKKTKSAGRFGARYGKKVKDKLVKVEVKQRVKQDCPFCKKKGVKRLSKGIWHCKKCDKKFASNTYYLDKEQK